MPSPRKSSGRGLGDLFVETVRGQNAAYHDLYRILRPLLFLKTILPWRPIRNITSR